MSRTVTANLTLSLDGRVAGPNGDFDMGWIVPHAVTPGAQDHMIRVTRPATTALLGRKNYQGFSGYWPSVAEDLAADPRSREFSRWLNEVEKVVFSTTLDNTDWSNSRVTAEDPAAVVAGLREQPGGDIVVLASMSVIRRLLEAGEVDRLSVTLCPEIVGGGTRLFGDGIQASWTLAESHPTESGAICLVYEPKR
ncbi:dihydrofolate reductase family protein [Phytomonospora endophytica]|uniref:Dihydrofolate reductase n=1 Tax=Phytomonospora endophytica TaxID=714109 RepID=A0A841FJQ3_9ACTN|nr:dihydrofolate reductase family protein [Phytomonospora endophytica]MBB6036065.1 dihydrofolate reductase [Phytomonospora endophytica]GIG66970.1 riboflavin biosynthesis protein RibD [Phytomonospora endophytica]